MKTWIFLVLGMFLLTPVMAQEVEELAPKNELSCAAKFELGLKKLAELDSIPVGIAVIHDPVSVEAAHQEKGKWKYEWSYSTTVCSLVGDVRIEEFGCFSWNGQDWVFGNFTGKPFSPEDFASWYNCPDAVISTGISYSDPSNWSATNCLKDSTARWYFIGTNENGNRVKGEAVVHELGRQKD